MKCGCGNPKLDVWIEKVDGMVKQGTIDDAIQKARNHPLKKIEFSVALNYLRGSVREHIFDKMYGANPRYQEKGIYGLKEAEIIRGNVEAYKRAIKYERAFTMLAGIELKEVA